MQVFVIDGVLQAASLLVHLPILGQLFALFIQLRQTLLQLSNLPTTTGRLTRKKTRMQESSR